MSEVWVKETGLRYEAYYATIGPFMLRIYYARKCTGLQDEWVVRRVLGTHDSDSMCYDDSYDRDILGSSSTLHEAKEKALAWVKEQIRVAVAELEAATIEWTMEGLEDYASLPGCNTR